MIRISIYIYTIDAALKSWVGFCVCFFVKCGEVSFLTFGECFFRLIEVSFRGLMHIGVCIHIYIYESLTTISYRLVYELHHFFK